MSKIFVQVYDYNRYTSFIIIKTEFLVKKLFISIFIFTLLYFKLYISV